MNVPFTQAQFLEVFKAYNAAVFPAQIIFYLTGFVSIYLAMKPAAISGNLISGILAFFWLWMGIVYHLVFFSSINKAAYLFGAAFILQGILFLAMGVLKKKLSIRFRPDIYGFTGSLLFLYALFIYPVLSYFLGHIYPAAPTFGLPCPTTIFTFGLLLWSEKKCPVAILIIPLLWSLLGFTAALQFGILEDTGLLVAGLLSVTLILVKNKSRKS